MVINMITIRSHRLLKCLALLIGFMTCGPVSTVWAFTLPEADHLIIASEYVDSNAVDSVFKKNWHVTLQKHGEHVHRLTYFVSTNLDRPLCEIKMDRTDNELHIRWSDARSRNTLQDSNGLLLVLDFPAPCNLLPINQSVSKKKYTIHREAGGRTFVQQYHVTRRTVDYEVALENGWITKQTLRSSQLIMLAVSDEYDRIVVKQLWPAQGGWWLYEETPNRRSWLVQ